MVKSGQFNFVVMDVKMPVMDGYTATRLIREWETEQGRARVPILLLSAEEAAVPNARRRQRGLLRLSDQARHQSAGAGRSRFLCPAGPSRLVPELDPQ